MKVIVQIPCFNERHTLADVVAAIPDALPGVTRIEILVVDDGSTDGTADLARQLGVSYVVRHARNKGLAQAFQTGMQAALKLGADIIVNTDGDNQYPGADIERLIAPIVHGEAEIVVGDRGGRDNPNFSNLKKRLQVTGSSVIRRLSGLDVPDAVSGFRALSRTAAEQINIVSDFSYTIEMLIQAGAKRLAVESVPITTNPARRDSRLFKSIPQFLRLSGMTLLRIYTMYKPLRVFFFVGLVPFVIGTLPIARFLWLSLQGDSAGHIQSLILGGTGVIVALMIWLIGVVADLIAFNRKLIEGQLTGGHELRNISRARDTSNPHNDSL